MTYIFGLSYGTLKVKKTEFLKRHDFEEMLRMTSPSDFLSYLGGHGYESDISSNSTHYSGFDLVEASNNFHLARMNRTAISVTPREGRDVVAAYLTKWDIQNIKTILVSKNLNLKVEETEMYLISESNVPLGIFAGLLSYSDYKNLLGMVRVEDIITYLLRYGYGKALLSYLEDYRKSSDLTSLLLSLDLYYYGMMKDKFRFYSGTEGPIYRFIRGNIDIKNIMTILKFKEFAGDEEVKNYLLPGGTFSEQHLEELVKSSSVEEVIQKLKWFADLSKGLDFYKKRGSLAGIEGGLNRGLYREFIEILDMSALSINNVLAYVLRAEAEWMDVRNIALGRYYNIDEETIRMISMNMG